MNPSLEAGPHQSQRSQAQPLGAKQQVRATEATPPSSSTTDEELEEQDDTGGYTVSYF